jgi:hypothetical protein
MVQKGTSRPLYFLAFLAGDFFAAIFLAIFMAGACLRRLFSSLRRLFLAFKSAHSLVSSNSTRQSSDNQRLWEDLARRAHRHEGVSQGASGE